jgi:adenylosuccinate synthase
MLRSKFNVVTDGQWGSCGKGLISTALAYKFLPEMISTTNMANAGHTAVNDLGEAFVAKAVPSCSAINRWNAIQPEHEQAGVAQPYKPFIFIGATAAFHLDRLLYEIEYCNLQDKIIIHERSGVITESHQRAETQESGTKHIASTMQGCGAFLADKVMRRKDLKLARDYPQLANYMAHDRLINILYKLLDSHYLTRVPVEESIGGVLGVYSGRENSYVSVPSLLSDLLEHGKTILHEGSQGFSLDINHGSHYPQCTSRGTTAVQNLADMGLPAQSMGHVYLVIRPYPIRVGNVIEEGQVVGYSGGVYHGQQEISWSEVAQNAGAPPEIMQKELTTVTKRLRRVFTFSAQQIIDAVAVNGATHIALNFANYIDWSCYGTNDFDMLPVKVLDFIKKIEDIARIPVSIVGTGPQNNHVCFRD